MMRIMLYSFLLFSLTISELSLAADIYKWVDKNGKVHFSDKAPKNNNVELVDERMLTSRASSYTQVDIKPLSFGSESNRNTDKLVMYTTTNCGYCAKARKYFAEHRIPYQEKNIDTSKKYHREFKKFGGKGVPVLFWSKHKMTGFSESKFKKMYAKLP